ncbi:alpha-ketoglutarate-dependent taurine dioxygenase [Embleya sp. AB8]
MTDPTIAGLVVRPMATRIGAEISGVDLSDPLDDEVADAIWSAVLRWKVVFFREQHLDHAGHVALARRFGAPILSPSRGDASPAAFPQVQSMVDRLELAERYGQDRAQWLDRRRHTLLRDWHSDLTPWIDPPAATMLRAEAAPPYGGDTTWANLAAAYAGLSEPLRRLAESLRAEHRRGVGYLPLPGHDAYAQELQERPVVSIHPLVRVHPETGERVLLVNPYYVERFVELSRAESRALLELFVDQATRPEYTVRFPWEPGSIAFWDNRATIHLAAQDRDHLDSPRILHRVMLAGDVPVGVDGTPSTAVAGAPLTEPKDELAAPR